MSLLKRNLEQTTILNRALTYYDFDSKEEIIIPESDISIIELGEVAEGIGTTYALERISKEKDLYLPIAKEVYAMLEGKSPQESLRDLLSS